MTLSTLFKGARLFWLIIIALVALFFIVAFFRLQPPKNRVDPTKIPKPVAVHQAVIKPLEIVYTTQGTVEARQHVDMNPEVAGVVKTIYVNEGQWVRQGQALMSLKASRQQAQLSSSRANRSSLNAQNESQVTLNEQLKADLDVALSNQRLAQQNYDDFNALYEQEVISRQERDQRLNALQTAQGQVRRIQQQQQQNLADIKRINALQREAQSQIRYNQAAVSETTLRAPFSGRVGLIAVDPGDYVMPTEAVLSIVNDRSIEVSFYVPEQHRSTLKLGQRFYIKQGDPDNTASHQPTGELIFINPTIDPDTRTVQVKGRLLTNTAHTITPASTLTPTSWANGQFIRISLVTEIRDQSIVIPEEALVPQGEAQYVYIAQQNESHSDKQAPTQSWIAVFTKVRIGQRQTGAVEIIDGLNAGDYVIINNQQKLFDGAPLIDPIQAKTNTEPTTKNPTTKKDAA